jgi:hypothetical protein
MDPHRVQFSNAGQVNRIVHPVDGGDDCTIFTVPEVMLREVVARHRPADAERPDRVLCAPDAPASARTYLLHRLLLVDLMAGSVEPLRLQTRVLDLLEAALTTAHGTPERRPAVGAAARRHRELAAGGTPGPTRPWPSHARLRPAPSRSPRAWKRCRAGRCGSANPCIGRESAGS